MPRQSATARQASSAAATPLTHSGSHAACEATDSAALATSIASGSFGSSAGFGSATVQRQLAQAPFALRKALAEGHVRSRQPQPVAQAVLLGKHHPAREAREPCFDV